MFRNLLIAAAVLVAVAAGAAQARVRHYYIAADEIDWNFMPGWHDDMSGEMAGMDMAAGGMKMPYAKFYDTRGPHLNGPVYRKAVYREYTDASFAHLKPRPDADAYLGLVGPVVHAEVGDTIKILFRNNGTHPYSLHPHGVFYEKASEGAAYPDDVPMSAKGGDSVAPGHEFEYTWEVPERAGPGPNDPSSIVWLYHSHVEERADVNSGLIGVLVITRKGMARADGTPKDVDRELVALYMEYDENRSWFIDANMRHNMGDPTTDLSKNPPFDLEGKFDPLVGQGPGAQNFRFTINGFSYNTMPPPALRKNAHARWYVVTLGEAFNFHTPHWHGNTVLVGGQRTDVVSIGPAQMITADMTPDAPGLWLMHCHVSDHMDAGMVASYRVTP